MNHRKNKNREKGTSLFLGTTALVFIVPLLGLFIDVGILYAAKARLQAAVDGASLAAARSLNLGQTTTAQAANAKQIAVNWFYANFPTGNWATNNTVMSAANVQVFDDPNNAQLRTVTVAATTRVPTWFMKWFNVQFTALTGNGSASRRDVVAMLVMDRSGSMCAGSQPCGAGDGTPCDAMITAAKTFVGQFAAGRDRIGMLSFSDGAYVHSAPTTNFQTVLGYTNSAGNGSGAIDAIKCNGGTGTANAMSLAYNELYKLNLPGALNLVMLETDGLPNTASYNFSNGTHAGTGLNSSSGCKDATGSAYSSGNSSWNSVARITSWTNGHSMNTGGTGFMADIPAGAIGAVYSSDPSQNHSISVLTNPWQTSGSGNNNTITLSTGSSGDAPGCSWSGYSDFNWLPGTDIYGNSVSPANAYQSISLSSGRVNLVNSTSTDWPNVHAAALNITDNSAYRIRTNATLPAYVFAIGLGGNGDPPDPILLQRMTNDPNGDVFNTPATYPACATETGCITYSTQPQGVFIYSPDAADLGQAYLKIASQILRLSH